MNRCSGLAHWAVFLSFFFFPWAEVSDYLQTKILLLFCSITTCWVLNDAIHSPSAIFFFSPSPSLSVHFACVFHLVGLGRLALNKCHFSHPPPPPLFQVALFSLQIHSSFQYLFSSSLLLSLSPSLFFSTSRRVLLYSFVILIDCINLLSIEFPVHHAEHNVEYYHNPSK